MSTGIEWTDETWNPITGCTKVSPGCDHCYAERITNRFGGPGAFDTVVLHPDRLDKPLHWRRPRRVFVNSMSDLFHDDVPDEFIERTFVVMALAPRHQFQILTKRPGRMASLLGSREFVLAVQAAGVARIGPPLSYMPPNTDGDPDNWPLANVWLGTSVEDQRWADIRIPKLLETPAAVRFLSCEPLLGPIDLTRIVSGQDVLDVRAVVDWVIVGGESGPDARPMHPAWARSLRDQCVEAGVPFLFKQWGEWSPERPAGYHKVSERRWSHQMFSWARDGSVYNPRNPPCDHFPSTVVYRIGKHAAGRELDGRTWDEYPRELVAAALSTTEGKG